MRELVASNKFLKDLDRVKRTVASTKDTSKFLTEISLVVGRLLFAVDLEQRHRDHALTGDWVGFRDCHVFNDLVLIYRVYDKQNPHKDYGSNALVLARLGSHSELDL